MQRELPTGTVTFLFTDVEGSTKLLHDLGANAYAEGLAAHRRAIRQASELSDVFQDGTFFVPLAPLRETRAARSTVAEAVGLQADDDVAGWLASRRVLLVLDNLEHLEGVAAVVAELLVGEVVVLATSRATASELRARTARRASAGRRCGGALRQPRGSRWTSGCRRRDGNCSLSTLGQPPTRNRAGRSAGQASLSCRAAAAPC